jgi:hypothetical protein
MGRNELANMKMLTVFSSILLSPRKNENCGGSTKHPCSGLEQGCANLHTLVNRLNEVKALKKTRPIRQKKRLRNVAQLVNQSKRVCKCAHPEDRLEKSFGGVPMVQ